MLVTLEQAAEYIKTGKLLHIAGAAPLLRRLPEGNWIGGSTEYFMSEGGGKVSDRMLSVMEIPGETYKIVTYDAAGISSIGLDAFANGFTVLILPFDSEVHMRYAENAAEYDNVFLNPVIGWIAGYHLEKPDQRAVSANGVLGEVREDRAVALHVSLPEGHSAELSMVNIFAPDLNGPTIVFGRDGFVADTCLIDGKETVFAEYVTANGLNTKLPLVGDFSGADINTSIKAIEDGKVYFYAPLSAGVRYHFAKTIDDYVHAFRTKLDDLANPDSIFACNCVLNFLYGELEDQDLGTLYGPVTFGEIAWQSINQTLVYLRVNTEA
jgi:hypothetical protein